VWWRWEGVLVAFPIVSYGFTAHQYLFQIYPASQRPSMKKMTTAVQRGMLLSALIYVAVGACGYSAFGNRCARGEALRFGWWAGVRAQGRCGHDGSGWQARSGQAGVVGIAAGWIERAQAGILVDLCSL